MGRKVLIVGGVAGGASAAARLRRLDETAEIILLERDEYISFANCGLPYYIGGSIDDRSKLLVQTPQGMKDRYGIDVRINSEVIQVNAENKTVLVKSKNNGIYEENFDALILSPGAKAIKPNLPGIQSEKIFTLRNIPDTDKIKAYVDQKGITSALVIGGGFVGIEMAENLRERGISVTLVEAAPHVLAPFDTDIVLEAEMEMKNHGVQLVLGDGVKTFRENGQQVEVTLTSDRRVFADLVILAIGVTPDTHFLKESGIELGARGHILVNDRMETNKDGIYAVGDAIEVVDYVTGNKTAIPLAGPANKQGRIAADNVVGLDSKYLGTQGTSVIKVFEMTLACTGANERTLKKADIFYNTIVIHPVSHASYYPGAVPMSLKLLFDREGKVLGAQAAGYEGVEKRIDVIATVLHLKGNVNHLAELELSYAPPYSSAKGPVNMAGFAAQNVLEGRSHLATWEQIALLEEGTYELIDVRSELEYENGHIKGAKNIPLDSIRGRLSELDKNKTIVEYCQVGLRGYIADRLLTQYGFKVLNVTGGYRSAYDILLEVPQQSRLMAASLGVAERAVIRLDPDTQTLLEEKEMQSDKIMDACGLCCPGPLLKLKTSMDEMKEGEVLKVIASDPGFYEDVKAWSKRTNTELLNLKKEGGIITAHLRKEATRQQLEAIDKPVVLKDNKTMVVFSGDLDKAIASFIIANGAASMGKKVTMFFTFWGLNILRKPDKQKVSKGFIDRMFGVMMPRGSKKLKLSNMNMLGMGGKMIRMVMKNKKISSLEELIQFAVDSGIEIVACQMSMDVMGLKQEELIDGVKIGGVGYYLGEAEDSNVNLFI